MIKISFSFYGWSTNHLNCFEKEKTMRSRLRIFTCPGFGTTSFTRGRSQEVARATSERYSPQARDLANNQEEHKIEQESDSRDNYQKSASNCY